VLSTTCLATHASAQNLAVSPDELQEKKGNRNCFSPVSPPVFPMAKQSAISGNFCPWPKPPPETEGIEEVIQSQTQAQSLSHACIPSNNPSKEKVKNIGKGSLTASTIPTHGNRDPIIDVHFLFPPCYGPPYITQISLPFPSRRAKLVTTTGIDGRPAQRSSDRVLRGYVLRGRNCVRRAQLRLRVGAPMAVSTVGLSR
jgi:hypothetical protein